MKPLNIDKTGCSNISSNCVSWQGPDIPCIGLCKGDSVTEVVYKLAVELCSLMETFDLTNYDLSCFSTGVCQPQSFKDFINILINKVCALQACNPACGDSCNPCPPNVQGVLNAGKTVSTDQYVPIAREFQYKNPTGDLVTSMAVSDYAQAVGNKVSTLINSTKIVQDALADHSARLNVLEKQGPPTFEMPTVTPVGVLPREATSMQLVLAATEQQLTELKIAVGTSSGIYSNLQKLDPNVHELKSLSKPGTNVANLRGFNAQPATLADVVGNTCVLVADMRNALKNLIENYIPSTCDAISLDLVATVRQGQVILYVTGTLPVNLFTNTLGTPTTFTISDNHGTSIDYPINIFGIINALDGYVIDMTSSRLVTSDNLRIVANPSFTHKDNGSVCKSHLEFTIVNQGTCPVMQYIPTTNSINFSMQTNAGTQAYTVELWDSSGTSLVKSQTFMSNNIQQINGVFDDLHSRTPYKVRVKITINSVETPCEFTSVTTI